MLAKPTLTPATLLSLSLLSFSAFVSAHDADIFVENTETPSYSARSFNDVITSDNQAEFPNLYKSVLPIVNYQPIEPSRELPVYTPSVIAGSKVNAKLDTLSILENRAFGTFGVPYTSGRVSHDHTNAVPATSGAYLSATYPYRTVGRLTFRTPDGFTGFCSASVIGKSLIVTAAHCIQDFGSGRSRNSHFTFTPAAYNNIAPYGEWRWRTMARPSSWANGTDLGEGAIRQNDIAVMLLRKNSEGKFLGELTGTLTYGWNNYSFVKSTETGNLNTAAITTLGYPGLLDSGRIMQRTDGPAYLATIGGVGQIYQGSNLTGGSSGGPWVANFRARGPQYTGGSNAGIQSIHNIVVGVTSWGASDPNVPKNNYSSRFEQNSRYPKASYGKYGAGNIGSLVRTVCEAKPSGSSKTYDELGYCF